MMNVCGYARILLKLMRIVLNRNANKILNSILKAFNPDKYNIFIDIPIYVINLSHRSDRLRNSKKTLARMSASHFNLFPAIYDDIPIRGCSKSHLEVLKYIDQQNHKIAMICEDDIEFIGNLSALQKAVKDFLQCNDAMVLCLAHFTRSKSYHSKYLFRTSNTQTAACYIIKKEIVRLLIKNATEAVAKLTQSKGLIGSFDKNWKKLQQTHVFCVPRSNLVIQSSSYSDIEKRRVVRTT